MAQHGKAHTDALTRFDREKLHTPDEAFGLVKALATKKFDETVEIAFRLGVDPRKADQMVRGTVNLPHGTGKTARVLVFAAGEKADEARAAGADHVGSDDLIEKVAGGFTDFDAAVATPDLMGKVGRLGKVLGPRGLMPNPKVGTVSPDVANAVKNAKSGQVRYRVDKAGIVHCTIGKATFELSALKDNLMALIADLQKAKPAAAKGIYLKRVTLSSTMGPGIAVDHSTLSS